MKLEIDSTSGIWSYPKNLSFHCNLPFYFSVEEFQLKAKYAYLTVVAIMIVVGVGSYYYFVKPSTHLFQMSATDVDTYGFYYPITFTFTFPAGSSSLEAWHSYTSTDWSQLPERQGGAFFNGEDAVRFDYAGNRAYVSVGFKGHTSLYIKITDSQGHAVETTYLQVAKYYDNRHCAVTSHHDDYGIGEGHLALIEEFQKRKLWYGCAVVTGFANWTSLQSQVNEGYVEVQSHSISHPNITGLSDSQAWNQIEGSRNAILNHISKMPYGQYVLVFVFPYTKMGDRDRNYLGKAEYLVSESDSETNADHPNQYSDWYVTTYKGESHGVFPAVHTTSMGSQLVDKGDDDGDGIINGMDEDFLNKKFDESYSSGGIYELMSHPTWVRSSASYCQRHLDYISGRKDCWYAPLGHMYAYHYVALFVQHSKR